MYSYSSLPSTITLLRRVILSAIIIASYRAVPPSYIDAFDASNSVSRQIID